MKTYETPGLLCFRMNLRAGKAWMTIDFDRGFSSGYSSTCASFSTDNDVVQALIENSPEFKTGRIIEVKPCR